LTEVLALWLHRKLRVHEFPSTYIGRNEGVSKLRFIDLFKASVAIFEVSSRYRVRGFGRTSTALDDSGVQPAAIAAESKSARAGERGR
jgi:hypothetical protein